MTLLSQSPVLYILAQIATSIHIDAPCQAVIHRCIRSRII